MVVGPINPTALTPPRVAFIDSRTGAISREWYRFFLSLVTATKDNQNAADEGPDAVSLLASYDAVFSDAIQALESTPDAVSLTTSLEDRVNVLAQSVDVQPRNELGTISYLQQDNVPWLTFSPVPSNVPVTVGTAFWDGGQTLNLQQTLNVAGKINEDNYYYIKADSTISKGQLVMFTGAVGASGVLKGAPATGLGINDGVRLMGIAAENIAANGFGLVQWAGTLRGFNTTGSPYGETWADGDILYYNPAYAGGLTKVEPTAPNVRAVIAAVINAGSGGSGSVAIRLSVGSVLGGTDSNVYINGLANGDVLQYDGVQQRWENTPVSSLGTGTVTSVNVSGGTTGLTTSGGPITTSGTITLAGTLKVANGGTGATSLSSGYLLKGNGTSAVSASVAYDNGSSLLIGTTFDKGRLTVSGATFSNAPVLGSPGGIANFSNPDVDYGLLIGVNSADGHAWLQAQRTVSPGAAYTISLNEAGGNVAVGKSTAATALDVNGTVTATSFSGAGTGLTGTAASLSIGGSAASATTAGSVTNSITFNNSGTGAASGTTFNGSAARTISYNTIGAQPAGTYVTSVSGSAPVVSSGGTTPTISMAAATGSVNGYLTSTDWTTFNSKQAALVSGTNIKTVNGTSLLGSGDVGTIATGYGGTGLTSFNANGIMYASSTSALATSSALTFNGTNFATTGTASATKLIPTGGTASGNGMYLPATNALAFSTNGSERARFTSAGEFLVNTTSPAAGNWFSEIKFTGADVWPLALNANNRGLIVRNSAATSGFYAYFEYNGGTANGSISWSGGTTAFNTTSDARIKDNIVDAPEAGDLIDGIKVRSWDFKADGAHWRYGMVAQELLDVVPEAVSVPSDEDIMMGVDYSKLVPLLVKEVQSLRVRVAQLENV